MCQNVPNTAVKAHVSLRFSSKFCVPILESRGQAESPKIATAVEIRRLVVQCPVYCIDKPGVGGHVSREVSVRLTPRDLAPMTSTRRARSRGEAIVPRSSITTQVVLRQTLFQSQTVPHTITIVGRTKSVNQSIKQSMKTRFI